MANNNLPLAEGVQIYGVDTDGIIQPFTIGTASTVIYGDTGYSFSATGTTGTIDIVTPTAHKTGDIYCISVDNTNASGILTVYVENKETFATAKYPILTSFTVATSTATSTLVQGWFTGEKGRIALSSASGGLSGSIRIRKV